MFEVFRLTTILGWLQNNAGNVIRNHFTSWLENISHNETNNKGSASNNSTDSQTTPAALLGVPVVNQY